LVLDEINDILFYSILIRPSMCLRPECYGNCANSAKITGIFWQNHYLVYDTRTLIS
jgi:hypothetical protein